jgi:hypothetical protein
MAKQSGLFDVDDRLKRLSELGDQLLGSCGWWISSGSVPNWRMRWPMGTGREAAGRRSIR